MNISVLKKCKDERCIFTQEEIQYSNSFDFYISYESQKIDLDNDDKPLQNQTHYHRISIKEEKNEIGTC